MESKRYIIYNLLYECFDGSVHQTQRSSDNSDNIDSEGDSNVKSTKKHLRKKRKIAENSKEDVMHD